MSTGASRLTCHPLLAIASVMVVLTGQAMSISNSDISPLEHENNFGLGLVESDTFGLIDPNDEPLDRTGDDDDYVVSHVISKRDSNAQVNELLFQIMSTLGTIEMVQKDAKENEVKIHKLAKAVALTSLALMGGKMSAQEKRKILEKVNQEPKGLETKHENAGAGAVLSEPVPQDAMVRSFGIGRLVEEPRRRRVRVQSRNQAGYRQSARVRQYE